MRRFRTLGSVTLVLGVAAGCVSSPAPEPPRSTTAPPTTTQPAAPAQPAAAPAPAAPTPSSPPASAPRAPSGVVLREEKGFGQVWLAPGFDFRGYDTLLAAEPRAEVPSLNPDGAENLEWAQGELRIQLAAAIRERGLFTVITNPSDARPGSRVLRLDSTIVEYEKGGGSARFFGGVYGAGHPVIKVRGQLAEADRPLFVYEARRSSVSTSGRFFGGFRGDKGIHEEDIKDLAKGLGDFMTRTKGP